MTLTQSLLIIAALIATSAFFSLAEISLAASRRLRLRQMADEGDVARRAACCACRSSRATTSPWCRSA